MTAPRPSSLSAPIRRGLTLVEALVSLAIVGLLVLAGLSAMGASFRFRQAARTTTGDELALSLITEIVQSNYEEPDVTPLFGREFESSGNRDGWDDVDDYDGWSASPPQAKDGTVMTGFTGWTHAASVQRVDPMTLAAVGTDVGLKLIIVTVISPSGAKTTLTALRSANGSYDERPALDSEVLTWIGFELEPTDADGATIAGATNLLNPIVVETHE
jgi:prepilin-type N-terminal cleavage/methylation domain-containing protein